MSSVISSRTRSGSCEFHAAAQRWANSFAKPGSSPDPTVVSAMIGPFTRPWRRYDVPRGASIVRQHEREREPRAGVVVREHGLAAQAPELAGAGRGDDVAERVLVGLVADPAVLDHERSAPAL